MDKITIIGDLSHVTSYLNAFFNSGVKSIVGALDFSNVTSAGGANAVCYYCTRLEDVRFAPNTLSYGSNNSFYYATKLTDDSLVSIANGFKDGVTGQSFSLPTALKTRTLEIMGNVSQVTDNGVTYNFFTADPEGTTSLNSFITVTKGWTLA